MFRADVLRLLPLQKDTNGNLTGKRLVNDIDLFANHLPLHTVTLPEGGIGNRVPQSAGATLFVVYRDPAQPLRKIVLYDGVSIPAPGATMTQTLRGFLQSSLSRSAKMTHIVGSGGRNRTERLGSGSLITTDPSPQTDFFRSNLVQSDFQRELLDARQDSGAGYGEVTTKVDHKVAHAARRGRRSSSARRSDTDGDGLPTSWRT
jgi:hypothetical protein